MLSITSCCHDTVTASGGSPSEQIKTEDSSALLCKPFVLLAACCLLSLVFIAPRDQAWHCFYLCINLGFVSCLLLPLLCAAYCTWLAVAPPPRDEARPWQVPLLSQQQSLPLPPLPPGATFASQYDVVLLIDQREQYSRTGHGARTLNRTGVCVGGGRGGESSTAEQDTRQGHWAGQVGVFPSEGSKAYPDALIEHVCV